jgi:hypothetical protein
VYQAYPSYPGQAPSPAPAPTSVRWAAYVSTVLFAIATWGTISLRSGTTSAWGVLGAVVGWLIGLAVIVLLWQRSASCFFRDPSRY